MLGIFFARTFLNVHIFKEQDSVSAPEKASMIHLSTARSCLVNSGTIRLYISKEQKSVPAPEKPCDDASVKSWSLSQDQHKQRLKYIKNSLTGRAVSIVILLVSWHKNTLTGRAASIVILLVRWCAWDGEPINRSPRQHHANWKIKGPFPHTRKALSFWLYHRRRNFDWIFVPTYVRWQTCTTQAHTTKFLTESQNATNFFTGVTTTQSFLLRVTTSQNFLQEWQRRPPPASPSACVAAFDWRSPGSLSLAPASHAALPAEVQNPTHDEQTNTERQKSCLPSGQTNRRRQISTLPLSITRKLCL